jgi:YHS domain-containing protein
VCGTNKETADALEHTEQAGQAYHFCGSKRKEWFDRNLAECLSKSAAAAKGGHGCCGYR